MTAVQFTGEIQAPCCCSLFCSIHSLICAFQCVNVTPVLVITEPFSPLPTLEAGLAVRSPSLSAVPPRAVTF